MLQSIYLSLMFLPLLYWRSAPKRPLGKAELLVEASFADMRHCGDGNLSQAYKLVQKVRSDVYQTRIYTWSVVSSRYNLVCFSR